MDVRLAIIPAGAASSARQAQGIAEAIGSSVEAVPTAAITELLGALGGSPVGHFLQESRNTSQGSALSVARPEAGLLEALLILAKDHDLAVYDLDLHRLYDPAGGVDIDVLLPDVRLPFLTRDLLADLVRKPWWPDADAPYLIVERSDQDFIQAWLADDGTYQLEYREGGPESHFLVHTGDGALVTDVIWAWVIGDERWRTAVEGTFLDLDADDAADGDWPDDGGWPAAARPMKLRVLPANYASWP